MAPTPRLNATRSKSGTIWPRPKSPRSPPFAAVESSEYCFARLLKSYEPDLPQLHATFSKNGRAEEFACALTLSLPTGTLHATGTAARALTSCKHAFSELEAQLKKHQSRLRKDYEWKRKRPLRRALATSA